MQKLSQKPSESIRNLASEFSRANSVCPDNNGPSQNYLKLLSNQEKEDDRYRTKGFNTGVQFVLSPNNVQISEEHKDRPYIIHEHDKKIKSSKTNSFSFSDFGRMIDKTMTFSSSSTTTSPETKQALTNCQKELQKEIDLTEHSREYHGKQIVTLSEESKSQRQQLYAWALPNLIVDFERLWSCKVRRAALLEEMAREAAEILKSTKNEINFLLFETNPDFNGKENLLKSPKEILRMNPKQQRLLKEIIAIQAELGSAQIRVESVLPKLEPKSKKQRYAILSEVMSKHLTLTTHRHKLFGLDHSTSWDPDTSMKLSGLIGENKDEARRKKVDRKFREIVSDERTREGRLLRRWCGMSQGGRGSGIIDAMNQQAHVGGARAAEVGLSELHPRSILAFCKYFGECVIAGAFDIPADEGSQNSVILTELSTALVFHRIEPTITNYLRKSADAERRDGNWRKRVKILKCWTAEKIGIPTEFFTPLPPKRSSSPRNGIERQESYEEIPSITSSSLDDSAFEWGGSGVSPPTVPSILSDSLSSSLSSSFSSSISSMSSSPSTSTEKVTLSSVPYSLSLFGQTTSTSIVEEDEENNSSELTIDAVNIVTKDYQTSDVDDDLPPPPSSSPPPKKTTRRRRKRDYWRTSLLLSKLDGSFVPEEALYWFMAAMRMLHKEANLISGSQKPLDADTLFPILVYAAVHSGLPWIHQNLFFLRHFSLVAEAASTAGSTGESDYYLTCIEATISHVMSMELDFGDDKEVPNDETMSNKHGGGGGCHHLDDILENDDSSRGGGGAPSKADRILGTDQVPLDGGSQHNSLDKKKRNSLIPGLFSTGSSSLKESSQSTDALYSSSPSSSHGGPTSNDSISAPSSSATAPSVLTDPQQGEETAMEKLGSWLGAQQAMEDTIDVLEQEGWMA